MEKIVKWPGGEKRWDLNPDKFNLPEYLEFREDLRNQFGHLKKAGISERDLIEAWEKCGVIGINFTSSMSMGSRWATIEGFRKESVFDRYTDVPEGWKDRYGTDVGYWIEFLKMEPSEVGAAVKLLAKKYPGDGWGIRIEPREFYRTLFFHELAHTLPICGRFLSEVHVMESEERLKFEHEAWLWAVKMARQKNPRITILCHSRKKEDKLEHSNFCQWYPLLKRNEEFRKRQKAEAMKKAA